MKKIMLNSAAIWGLILFVTLICMVFILPVMPIDWQIRISRVLYTIVFFSAYFSMEKKLKSILFVSVIALITEWLAGFFDFWLFSAISKSVNVVFFFWIVFLLIRQVATSKEVNLRVILGSVIGYLLIGLIFSILVTFIMQQDPAAYNVTTINTTDGKPVPHFSESIYFSFISFATVGYGDILPLKPYSRSLAVLIGISGQLYIAIIIALLVGKFSALQHDRHKKRQNPDQ